MLLKTKFLITIITAAVLLWLADIKPMPAHTRQKNTHSEPNSSQEAAPEVSDLYLADTVDFPAPPPVVVGTRIKCDADANIYVVYSPSPAALGQNGISRMGQIPVSKIWTGRKQVVQYPLPAIPGYEPASRNSFDVSPRGELYMLIHAHSRDSERKRDVDYFIVKYKDDGTVESYEKVRGNEGESRFQPIHLAVFATGEFLLSGTSVGGERELGTFAGIFDRDAMFKAPITLGEIAAGSGVTSAKASIKPETNLDTNPVSLESNTFTVTSPDGNIYILQGTRAPHLYAVSAAGQVVRRFPLRAPAPDLSPSQMATAGVNYLFIDWEHFATGGAGENLGQSGMITVLNPETGQVIAIYRLPGGQVGFTVPACAESPDSFFFLGASKENQLEVVRYTARS